MLGIPTVRDRVVQTTLKMLLEPFFDPHFSAHSFGFRPDCSESGVTDRRQWRALRVGYRSIEFFDRIHHDRLIARMGQRIRARLMSQQKRKQHLYRHLVKRGVPRKQTSNTVFSNNKRWALSATRAVTRAYPNCWFNNLMEQEIRSDLHLAQWVDVSQWIRLAWRAVFGPVLTVMWAALSFGSL